MLSWERKRERQAQWRSDLSNHARPSLGNIRSTQDVVGIPPAPVFRRGHLAKEEIEASTVVSETNKLLNFSSTDGAQPSTSRPASRSTSSATDRHVPLEAWARVVHSVQCHWDSFDLKVRTRRDELKKRRLTDEADMMKKVANARRRVLEEGGRGLDPLSEGSASHCIPTYRPGRVSRVRHTEHGQDRHSPLQDHVGVGDRQATGYFRRFSLLGCIPGNAVDNHAVDYASCGIFALASYTRLNAGEDAATRTFSQGWAPLSRISSTIGTLATTARNMAAQISTSISGSRPAVGDRCFVTFRSAADAERARGAWRAWDSLGAIFSSLLFGVLVSPSLACTLPVCTSSTHPSHALLVFF